MKKILILILTICSLSGFGQILIDPTVSSISSTKYNTAVQGAVVMSGTDTYSASYLPSTITSYSGLALTVQFANPNTTTATFELNGLGPKTIKKQSGGALINLSANDIGPNERKDIYYDGTYIVLKGGTGSSGGGTWGSIMGTLSSQTDLQNALNLKAPLASPTFTGLVTFPTPWTLGAVSVTATGTELNYSVGVTSSIQTQLNAKQSTLVSGTNIKTVNSTSLLGSGDLAITTVSGNAGTATALQTARTIGIVTGDATSAGSSFDGTANNTNALTLATVNSNVGSFGSATQVGTFTVNGKGLVTAAGNTTITPAVGSITGLGSNVATYLATPTTANLSATIGTQTANTIFAGPSSGSAANATFRSQVTADLPFDTYTTQSGTTYTLVAADKNTCIRFTSSSTVTITLPNGITSGFSCIIIKAGTGDILLSAATTLEGSTLITGTAPSFAVVKNRGSDIWVTNGSYSSVTTIGTIDTQSKSSNGAVISGGIGYLQTADATNPGLVSTGTQTFTGNKTLDGSLTFPNVGQNIKVKEGTGGMMGQVALVSGTKAITISGVTTGSRAFVTLVTPSGTSSTITYQAVCTSNTLTLQANVAAGTINTSDNSTLNYFVINQAP